MSESPIAGFLQDMLSSHTADSSLAQESARLDEVAWHDFTRYQYILTPRYQVQPPPPSAFVTPLIEELASDDIPTGELSAFTTLLKDAMWAKYAGQVAELIVKDKRYTNIFGTEISYTVSQKLSAYGFDPVVAVDLIDAALDLSGEQPSLLELFWPLNTAGRISLVADIVQRLPGLEQSVLTYDRHNENGAASLYTQRLIRLGIEGDPGGWLGDLTVCWSAIAAAMRPSYGDSSPEPETTDAEPATPSIGYEFDLFEPNTVNLGLRFLHRQEWRPLGTQPGEIVKTIPLGPKQNEKISTKVVRRTKITKSSEQMKSVETSTETSDSTKDSSEVANETARSFGWHAELEASSRWGWGDAKISGGVKSEAEAKTKETNSHLTDSMQKTANKVRTESKVIVSTEGETQFEQSSSSEIQNPNDEIAVTYVYSKLQSQYAVLTRLADVTPIVMIAEPVPLPEQVTLQWIKRYDWIIAKELLDDSFRETLNALSQEGVPGDTSTLIDDLKVVLDASVASMGALASNQGNLALKQIDVSQEPQRGYQQAVREEAEHARQRNLVSVQQSRLLTHVRDNILHYCYAIWAGEDPAQRILRFRRLGLSVPTNYEFVGAVGGETGEWSVASLLQLLTESTAPEMQGAFQPVPDSPVVAVADLVEPSAPLGFVGNYAAFQIKAEYLTDDRFAMMHILVDPYLDPSAGAPDITGANVVVDPELLQIRRQYQTNPPTDLDSQVSNPLNQVDMVDSVPELRVKYQLAQALDMTAGVTGTAVQTFFQNLELFKTYYPDYLFRTARTRKVLLETNNLLIELLPSKMSILESFKRGHRYVDVLKAEEELNKVRIDNDRRGKLVEGGNLGDADIEHVTVVAGLPEVDRINVSLLDGKTATENTGSEAARRN